MVEVAVVVSSPTSIVTGVLPARSAEKNAAVELWWDFTKAGKLCGSNTGWTSAARVSASA